MKAVFFSGLVLSALTCATLFHVKYEVLRIEREAHQIQKKIARHQENLQVLRAEWAYLNTPQRLQKLSARYLDIGPAKATQILDLKKIMTSQSR